MVTVETYFSADGRLAARRDWRITNSLSGEVYGTATRCNDFVMACADMA